MKVWTVTDFPGFYPIGFAAVVVAPDEETAKVLFEAGVLKTGLQLEDRNGKHPYTLERLKITQVQCQILVSGNY